MSYKAEFVSHDLYKQLCQRIHSMNSYGRKKHIDKLNGVDRTNKIYAQKTLQNHLIYCRLFSEWCKKVHPDATIKTASQFVPEYLQFCLDKGLSVGTVKVYRASLNKIFKITTDLPNFITLPELNRTKFTRSRGEKKQDKHFSEIKHHDIVLLAKATGGRRNDLQSVQKGDLVSKSFLETNKNFLDIHEKIIANDALTAFPDTYYFIHFRRSKGGRSRYSPIDNKYLNEALKLFQGNPEEKVLHDKISKAADIHAYRAEYANSIYDYIARDVDKIPYDKINKGTGHPYQSDVYHCRGNMKGIAFDRKALRAVSIALGHGHQRFEIFVNNYFRP